MVAKMVTGFRWGWRPQLDLWVEGVPAARFRRGEEVDAAFAVAQ